MDQQRPPHGDSRRRVFPSVRFYVAELMVSSVSAAWHFRDSTERIVYRWPSGRRTVSYKGRQVPYRDAFEMEKLVTEHLALGLPAFVGGKALYPNEDGDLSFRPYPFIDVTDDAEHERYRAFVATRP